MKRLPNTRLPIPLRIGWWLPVFICGVILPACEEYQSAVPITTVSNAELDTNLLGTWYSASIDMRDIDMHDLAGKPVGYSITFDMLAWGPGEYLLLSAYSEDKAGTFSEQGRPSKCTVSKVGNYTFINVLPLPQPSAYIFYTFRVEGPDRIAIRYMLEDFPHTFTDSPTFYAFLRDHPEEIERYLDTLWIPYYRDTYWNWERANVLVLPEIQSMYEYVDPIDCGLLCATDSVVIGPSSLRPMDPDSLIARFNNYYLSGNQSGNSCEGGIFSGYCDPEKVTLFILEQADGRRILMIEHKYGLIDLTNRCRYSRYDP